MFVLNVEETENFIRNRVVAHNISIQLYFNQDGELESGLNGFITPFNDHSVTSVDETESNKFAIIIILSFMANYFGGT